MECTRLGNTGAEVSRICLGCMGFGDSSVGMTGKGWAIGEEEAREIIRRALELGINFFDTANVYSAGTTMRPSENVSSRWRRSPILRSSGVWRQSRRNGESR